MKAKVSSLSMSAHHLYHTWDKQTTPDRSVSMDSCKKAVRKTLWVRYTIKKAVYLAIISSNNIGNGKSLLEILCLLIFPCLPFIRYKENTLAAIKKQTTFGGSPHAVSICAYRFVCKKNQQGRELCHWYWNAAGRKEDISLLTLNNDNSHSWGPVLLELSNAFYS